MSESDSGDESRFDRRLVVVLLLAVLIPVGAGAGTFAFDFAGSGEDTTTEPVAVTPTSDAGPTGTPGESPGTATPTGSDGPSSDQDSTASDDGSDTSATPSSGGSTASGGGSDSDAAADDAGVSLRATSSVLAVRASGLAPGATGREAVTLRNTGDETGRLSVENIDVEDQENGVVPAEQSVDSSPDSGELSSAVLVGLQIETDDGATHLYGTGSGAKPLATLGSDGDAGNGVELSPGETATVVLLWRVPDGTGNEIQSDTATFDATITLEATA